MTSVARTSHAMPVSIAPERVTWNITGIVDDIGTLSGAPLPIAIGDPFSINLTFELTSRFTQCSPCVGTGDTRWDGSFTDFSVNLGGIELVADIGSMYPNFVIFQPGDDPTEVDYASMRLGNRGYEGVQTPVPLTYAGGILDAAFYLYIADFTGALMDEGVSPWQRELTIPVQTTSSDINLFIADRPLDSQFEGARLDLNVTSAQAVPEPPLTALLLLGVAGLGIFKRSSRGQHPAQTVHPLSALQSLPH